MNQEKLNNRRRGIEIIFNILFYVYLLNVIVKVLYFFGGATGTFTTDIYDLVDFIVLLFKD